MAAPQLTMLDSVSNVLKDDHRIVGVAVGGSCASGTIDEYSDVDLVIAVEPDAEAAVLAARRQIAAGMGNLLASFTGEHVGEPRLLICLYRDPLLHVDLKFVSLNDVAARVEDPVILWQRDDRLSAALREQKAVYPQPDLQWLEDRFWIWVHYCSAKIGRGELFEAIDFLSFLRGRALGPLALAASGAQPNGVRKIEQLAPDYAQALRHTVATYDRASCISALEASVALYIKLRQPHLATLKHDSVTEAVVMAYLANVKEGRED